MIPHLPRAAAVALTLSILGLSAAAQTSKFKVLISADMEGVAGVTGSSQTGREGHDYEVFRDVMAGEVNAAISAAYESGADEVVVVDAHGSGTNLRPGDLDRRAVLIAGFPMTGGMMTGIDDSFDAAIFIGYHASAAGAGILAHTYTNALHTVRLNEQEVGEWGLNAAIAGHYGVAVVFVAGDHATIEQVRAVIPQVEAVSVKEAVGRTAARMIHPDIARERIAAGVKKALARRTEIPPWTLKTPVTLEVELASTHQADLASLIPNIKRVDARTVSYTAPDAAVAYKVSVLIDHLTSR